MITEDITRVKTLSTQKQHSEAKKSEKLLEDYHSARSTWATQALEDDEFRNNVQWKNAHVQVLKKRSQSPSIDNQIHPAVEQAKAVLTANKPRFQATARETSDLKISAAISDLMSYIWEISRGNVQLKQVVDDYYVKGMGAMQVFIDKAPLSGDKEIFVKAINPLDLYIDPASRDPHIRDAAHVMIAKAMTEEQVVRFMPSFKSRLSKAKEAPASRYPSTDRGNPEEHSILPVDDDTTSGERRRFEVIDRYTKTMVTRHNIYDTILKREQVLNEDEYKKWGEGYVVAMHVNNDPPEYIVQEQQVQEILSLMKSVGEIYHFGTNPETGETIPVAGAAPMGSQMDTVYSEVLTRFQAKERFVYECKSHKLPRIRRVLSIGGIVAYQSMLEIGEYPIVTLMNRHNRNPYPISDVRFVKPIQEQINKYSSLILAHASNSTNTKVFIPKGSMNRKELEEQWGKAGTAVIEFDPEFGQPIVAGPIALPNELYHNVENLKKSIYDILGVYPLGQGDPTAAPTTYKGTVAIDEYGQRRMKSKVDDMEAFLNELAKCVVEMIPKIYTKRKTIQLLRPNNISQVTEINQDLYNDTTGDYLERMNDVTTGSYDVIVVSSSTLPSNRWARYEGYKEMYQLGLIDQFEVLKQTEVVDMEGVLTRTSEIQKMQGALQSAEEEIKKLKGDLQTAERAEINSRKRLEVEKFKTHINEAEGKAKSSAQLFDARLKDELSNIKKNLVADQN